MKNTKVIKMIAMVMIMVMMLSTSVFAAGNEGDDGISLASDFVYVDGTISDTLRAHHTNSLGIEMTFAFDVSCDYTVAISYESDYAYIYNADFDDEIDLSKYGFYTTLSKIREVDNGDSWYIDYQLVGYQESVRVWITCNQFGDVSLTAYNL